MRPTYVARLAGPVFIFCLPWVVWAEEARPSAQASVGELPAPAPSLAPDDRLPPAPSGERRFIVRNGAREGATLRVRKGQAIFSIAPGGSRTFTPPTDSSQSLDYLENATRKEWRPIEPPDEESAAWRLTFEPAGTGAEQTWRISGAEAVTTEPLPSPPPAAKDDTLVTLHNRSSLRSAVVHLRIDGEPRPLAAGQSLKVESTEANQKAGRTPTIEFFTGDATLDDSRTKKGWRRVERRDSQVLEFEISQENGKLVWTCDGRSAPSERLLPDLFFFD